MDFTRQNLVLLLFENCNRSGLRSWCNTLEKSVNNPKTLLEQNNIWSMVRTTVKNRIILVKKLEVYVFVISIWLPFPWLHFLCLIFHQYGHLV